MPVAAGASLQLAPDTRSFDIRYTAFHFASAQKIQFRYRMEGFDPNWIDAGTERSARYSRLPPGNYRFLVSARMPGAAWSGSLAVLAIRQLPQFHQTGWFWALVVLVLLGVAGAVFRWRVLIIKSRYAAVLSERNRIAREWHDTLLAGFAAISWQLDETASRIQEAPERAIETVEMALKMVKHYRAEARRVIWELREDRPESETLADAVASSLRRFGSASDTACDVRVEGQSIHLPEELERNVRRICQEAVSNARRHGEARHIELVLEYLADTLRVTIRDDGKGFDPKEFTGAASGHFGLAVMQERAQRFGGRLKLESHPGQGTTVEVAIPYEQHRT
jgi:signal transduction histidine kinase